MLLIKRYQLRSLGSCDSFAQTIVPHLDQVLFRKREVLL